MSDFITRLVTRTLGLGEVAQPLVASMFAEEKSFVHDPPGTLFPGATAPDPGEKVGPSAFSEIQAPPAGAKAGEKPVSRHAPPTVHDPSAPGSAETLLEGRPINDKGVHEANADDVAPGLPPERSEKALKNKTLTVNENIKIVIPESGEEPGNFAPSEKNHAPEVEHDKTMDSRIEPSEPGLLLDPSRVAGEGDHSLASKGWSRPEEPPVLDPATPSTPPRPARREEAHPAPRAIEVTIGRIDVRAVERKERTLPPRRPASFQPKLSLDDYLKQRDGGKR